MASTETQYEYMDLGEPGKNIRLLIILGDSADTPLRTLIDEGSLESAPPYIALSYVWGNAAADCALQVGDRTINIRRNLFDALRRLRPRCGASHVWIDAICINQANLSELSTQVAIMRNIYASANFVVAYLGEGFQNQQFGQIFDALHALMDPSKALIGIKLDLRNPTKHGLPKIDSPPWYSMARFLAHPWFSRVWTFQESLVARHCIVLHGDYAIEQIKLFRCLILLSLNRFDLPIHQESGFGFSPAKVAVQRAHSIVFCRASNTPEDPRPTSAWVPQPLILLLRRHTASKATDPRDYIFALIGISNEAEEPSLQPNYTKDLDEICLAVGKYMVEHGSGELLLGSVTHDLDPTRPSWVPRWHCHKQSSDFFSRPNRLRLVGPFSATNQSVSNFSYHADGHILRTSGIIYDKITRLGSRDFSEPPRDFTRTGDPREVLYFLTEAFQMLRTVRSPYPTGESVSEILYRLAVCDLKDRGKEKAPKEYELGLKGFLNKAREEILKLSRGETSAVPGLSKFSDLVAEILGGQYIELEGGNRKWIKEFYAASDLPIPRITFVTNNGYIGRVCQVVKVGDRIALLQGCEVPFVLRRREDRGYTFITICYVHGIMYGEGWKSKHVRDIEII